MSATQGTRRRLAGGEVGPAVNTGHGRGRSWARSNRTTKARRMGVVASPESDRSDDGDVCRGGPERGGEDDDDLRCCEGCGLAHSSGGGAATRVTRTVRQRRAPGHGGELAGGEALLP